MNGERKILFDKQAIAHRVRELAFQISADHAGKDLVLICILKAAIVFTADLMRELTIPAAVEFIEAMSYGGSTASSGTVLIRQGDDVNIAGKHVLLVDTIIDTGETMHTLLERFREHRPASIKVAALLDKESRRTAKVPVAYRGFLIPDLFVAGYGMDLGGKHRNLPDIIVIKP
jgi:hypoxanthine phosphoribosyltransferase